MMIKMTSYSEHHVTLFFIQTSHIIHFSVYFTIYIQNIKYLSKMVTNIFLFTSCEYYFGAKFVLGVFAI